MKKLSVPIVVTALGVLSIVLSAVLFSELWPVWFWVLLITGILLLVSGGYEFWRTAQGQEKRAAPPPENYREMPEYRKKYAVLTRPEREFFKVLKSLVSPQYFDIYPETALVTVIDKLTQASYRNELFRIADFCVVDAVTTEPLLLIELNDASHLRSDRAERDRKVSEICESAGIPLVAFTLEEAADTAYVRSILSRYL